jgi:septal ring factor EnvC (AmiA/AmiB activator)
MKIFDSSPGITLERPSRRRSVAATVAGVAVCLALAAAMAYQHSSYSARLARVSRDLAASRAEVGHLQANLAATKEKLDAAALNIGSCASNLNAETSKIAAFAKQAAACEVIRNKLHVKG